MNVERARTLLERAENQAVARGWGRLSAGVIAEQARLHLNDGRLDEAAACVDRLERLARKYPAPKPCAWSEIGWHHKLARAHLLERQTRFEQAISILQELKCEVETMQHRQFLISVATRLSAAQLGAGEVADAVSRFRRVLAACGAADLYQTVLDEGPVVSELIQRVAISAISRRTCSLTSIDSWPDCSKQDRGAWRRPSPHQFWAD
jgi:LuxR family maltose regulon positive regulatory protein